MPLKHLLVYFVAALLSSLTSHSTASDPQTGCLWLFKVKTEVDQTFAVKFFSDGASGLKIRDLKDQ